MTIQGAMNELVNLLNADDIPIYYKGGIEKVIETIDDYIDGKDDYIKRKTEPQPCNWCKFYDGENCFSQEPCKVMLYFKTEPQTYITEDRDTQILDAWQVKLKAEQTEPQIDDFFSESQQPKKEKPWLNISKAYPYQRA